MSVTSATVKTAARSIAQDPGSSAKLVLADADYDTAITQAIEEFRSDRPNVRVYHYTVAVAGFRFILAGTGAVLPTSGADMFVPGASTVLTVFDNYLTTIPDNVAVDQNFWRVTREPAGLTVLTFFNRTLNVGNVLRVEYTAPHVIHATVEASSSILLGDVTAFEVLTAAILCEMAARRYAQNTGTSTFQQDSVDRRSQSDIMASRAKDLRARYGIMVGKGDGDGGEDVRGFSATRKMLISSTHGRPRLWPHE